MKRCMNNECFYWREDKKCPAADGCAGFEGENDEQEQSQQTEPTAQPDKAAAE